MAARSFFPVGTTLAPNGLLVVANDRTNLLATHPALAAGSVLGNYGGKLSNSGDLVTLERILLDVRRVTGAQAQAAAQIDGVAGMASVVLAAARRGEY